MKEMSRVDAISLVPSGLADSFVVLLDDYNRSGERGMARDLRKQLEAAGVAFTEGVYRGDKETLLLCSRDKGFLTSL